jgi:hypothetical protein
MNLLTNFYKSAASMCCCYQQLYNLNFEYIFLIVMLGKEGEMDILYNLTSSLT